MTPYLLVFFGLLMIFIEFYLPGGIIGIIGGILVISGMAAYAVDSDSLLATILFISVSFVLLAALIRFALWRIPRAKPERSIYAKGDQEGYFASTFDRSAVGKRGTVSSDLKPGGHILIEGKVHQAISVAGYILKGETVEVIRGEGESLVVKKVKEEPS